MKLKKENDKKPILKTNIIIVLIVMGIIFGILAIMGIFKDFSARDYVAATLNHMFYGTDAERNEVLEGTSEEELLLKYEEGISNFAKSLIRSDIEIDAKLQAEYETVCKKIYKSMQFTVKDEEIASDEKYEVTVAYKPVDVISKYRNMLWDELSKMNEKVERGEYQGDDAEIAIQMENELLQKASHLLDEAYNAMEYGKEQTMVFKVIKDENDIYRMDEEEIYRFLEKILRLDEIQD